MLDLFETMKDTSTPSLREELMPYPLCPSSSARDARAWAVLGVLCLQLACLSLTTPAEAAEILVESATDEVIVVLDDQDQRSTPAGWKEVPPGSHTLGIRATPFGPIVFSEVIELAEDQQATVEIDISTRKARIEYEIVPAVTNGDDQPTSEDLGEEPAEAPPTVPPAVAE